MSQECFSIEELGDLLDLDSDDPRLAHVRECAQCRNLLASLREFESPTQLPSEADLPTAETHLNRFITAEIEVAEPAGGLGSFFRRLMGVGHPVFRPVTGLALVALAVIVILGVRDRTQPSDPFVVRDARINTAAHLILRTPESLPTGLLRLSWEPITDDVTYQVVLYTSGLDEIARYSVGSETNLTITPAEIYSGRFLWQVEAQAAGKTVATSQPAGIPIR